MKVERVITIVVVIMIGFFGWKIYEDYKDKKYFEELKFADEKELLTLMDNDYTSEAFLNEFNLYVRRNTPLESFPINIETKFNEKDFKNIKKSYNEAIRDVYLGNKQIVGHSINKAIEEVEIENKPKGSNITNLLLIREELLDEEIHNQVFSEEVKSSISKAKIALNRIKMEKRVHSYMKETFSQITNDGNNYNPDIHDKQVAKMASEKYDITPEEANNIFIHYEMQ